MSFRSQTVSVQRPWVPPFPVSSVTLAPKLIPLSGPYANSERVRCWSSWDGRIRRALAVCISIRYPEGMEREKWFDTTGALAQRHAR